MAVQACVDALTRSQVTQVKINSARTNIDQVIKQTEIYLNSFCSESKKFGLMDDILKHHNEGIQDLEIELKGSVGELAKIDTSIS